MPDWACGLSILRRAASAEPPSSCAAMTPRATYRLQLHKHFGFAAAAAVAPHLARLGVSHVYCSPYLKARPCWSARGPWR